MSAFDWVIIALYLVVIVTVGLAASARVKTIKDFSVSTASYGVFVLFATLCASFIGGGFSSGNASSVAQRGIGNIFALFGFSLGVLIVTRFIVPRMANFSDCISSGEIIKRTYGSGAQVATGVFSFLLCASMLGAQLSALGYMFSSFLGISTFSAMVISCSVVLLSSSLGGMKSVVATDVIQFVILIIGTPLLLFFAYKGAGGAEGIMEALPKEYFSITNKTTPIGFISLFLSFLLGEALIPPYVQRLLMGKSIKTTARATFFSALLSVPYFVMTGLIGLFGYAYFVRMGAAVDTNSIMQSVIKALAPPGVRGMVIASMFSVLMTTADALLNSASVTLVNDTLLPILGKRDAPSLFLARAATFLTVAIAIAATSISGNVLEVLTFAYTFWSPVLLVPLAGAILGVKGGAKVFTLCTASGAAAALWWKCILQNPFDIDGSIVGFLVNAAIFIVMTKNKK